MTMAWSSTRAPVRASRGADWALRAPTTGPQATSQSSRTASTPRVRPTAASRSRTRGAVGFPRPSIVLHRRARRGHEAGPASASWAGLLGRSGAMAPLTAYAPRRVGTSRSSRRQRSDRGRRWDRRDHVGLAAAVALVVGLSAWGLDQRSCGWTRPSRSGPRTSSGRPCATRPRPWVSTTSCSTGGRPWSGPRRRPCAPVGRGRRRDRGRGRAPGPPPPAARTRPSSPSCCSAPRRGWCATPRRPGPTPWWRCSPPAPGPSPPGP